MLYRALHTINSVYPYVALFGYLGAFFIAFGLMFIFPPGSLAILLVALLTLGIVVGARTVLTGWEYLISRSALAHGRCPSTGEPVIAETGGWYCVSTDTHFTSTGETMAPDSNISTA